MVTFNQADKQVHAALMRLKSPEMQALLAFFNKMSEESKTSLIRAEGVNLHRLQGRAGLLEELLESVENAGSTLEKLR